MADFSFSDKGRDLGDEFSESEEDPLDAARPSDNTFLSLGSEHMPDARLSAEELRALVDDAFQQLEIEAAWPRVAPPLGDAPALDNRTVVMVDDSADMIAAVFPALLAATNGKARYLLHNGESAEELAEHIQAMKPDLVLVDGELVGSVRGWVVTAALHARCPEIPTIGFSTDEGYEPRFLKGNAGAFVHKNIRMIPNIISNLNREAQSLIQA